LNIKLFKSAIYYFCIDRFGIRIGSFIALNELVLNKLTINETLDNVNSKLNGDTFGAARKA
jgi:hypothetical protein